MMMRIAVCDDEKEVRLLLSGKIRKLYPEADVFCYGSGEELLRSTEPFDILFLDIQMEGQNGMETAARLRKKDRDVILVFITALEEYVFQAFDVGAFHYLVKPWTDGDLAALFDEIVRRLPADDRYIEVSAGAGPVWKTDRQQVRRNVLLLLKQGESAPGFRSTISYMRKFLTERS